LAASSCEPCFFSVCVFLAILTQSSQGCFPSKVLPTPTSIPSASEYLTSMPTQAVACKIAQWPPINWKTAMAHNTAANLDFIGFVDQPPTVDVPACHDQKIRCSQSKASSGSKSSSSSRPIAEATEPFFRGSFLRFSQRGLPPDRSDWQRGMSFVCEGLCHQGGISGGTLCGKRRSPKRSDHRTSKPSGFRRGRGKGD
jgi:hypothetical protein